MIFIKTYQIDVKWPFSENSMSDPLQFYNNLGTGKDRYNCCLKLTYL